jgi:hypothetical protein
MSSDTHRHRLIYASSRLSRTGRVWPTFAVLAVCAPHGRIAHHDERRTGLCLAHAGFLRPAARAARSPRSNQAAGLRAAAAAAAHGRRLLSEQALRRLSGRCIISNKVATSSEKAKRAPDARLCVFVLRSRSSSLRRLLRDALRPLLRDCCAVAESIRERWWGACLSSVLKADHTIYNTWTSIGWRL